MTRFSHLTLRNFLIALHDLLVTTAALFAAFYLRFEGGDGFYDRLPLLLQILPYFLAFSVVVFFVFNLTTTKWRFISLPDALNILRVASVLTVALLVLDYIFVAPNVRGAFFLGKVTIVLYWFLEVSFLSALRFAYRYFRYTRVRHHAREETMKRLALLVLAGLAIGVPTAPPAWAQEFPTRQITLIAPWPAGGAVDAICRALAQPLSERLGKSVVVENRPGAGSVIGTAAGAKAAPDGYTMVMAGSGSLAISATMYKKLPYDPVKDFIPLTMGAKIPFVLVVNPSLPVHSPAELVAYAKANPGKLSFASGGPGSPHHLYGELLKSMTGIEMTHVPYKGSAPALTDVIAGHVPLLFSDTVPSLPQIREGKVRALGVSTAVRLPSAPEIPPIAEGGVPGFDAAGWGVFSVPAGTPKEVVSKLQAALNSVLALPEVQQQIIRLGMIPEEPSSPEELQRFINGEIARWGKVVQQAGLAGTE